VFGIVVSAACLVHCLVLPVVLAGLPTLAHRISHDPLIHYAFLAITIPVGLLAFIPGFLLHRHKGPILGAAVGLLGLSLGAFGHDALGHKASHAATVLGGIILISAHLLNARWKGKCACRAHGCNS
jgi:hypothetical protein